MSELDVISGNRDSLKSVYERLYAQNHFLRTSIQNNTTWVGAALLAADGWIVASTAHFTRAEIITACGLYVWIGAAAIATLISHYHEYNANARMIVRVESAFGFYTPNLYLSGEGLFRAESSRWGTKFTGHILWTNIAILTSLVVLSICVLFIPKAPKDESVSKALEQLNLKIERLSFEHERQKPAKP
jgi:hypothetical protein